MTSAARHPKVFISYSWSSEEHEAWVLNLATELRQSGVDAILDKWDLREGQDAHAFMEQMGADPKIERVILVCDANYVEKANARAGGVGTEAQIISPAMYGQIDQRKFVAVVRERNADGQAYVPAYYGSRIYIDLSSVDVYASNFEQLLRWIFDKPILVKPALSSPPLFVTETAPGPSLENTPLQKRALDAIRNQKANVQGLVDEYFDSCANAFEKFRLSDDGATPFDDKVVASIDSFAHSRNEFLEIVVALVRFDVTNAGSMKIHRFFERLLPFYDVPGQVNSYREWDFDNYKFIVHELFLMTVAFALKGERFDIVEHLVLERYLLLGGMRGAGRSESFVEFRAYMKSLEVRSQRLKLRRLSVRADKLKERVSGTGLEFRHLAQADFVLYLRSCMDDLKANKERQWGGIWWPETLLFVRDYEGAFEIFLRAESATYFDRIKHMLRVENKAELGALFEAYKERRLEVPRWEHQGFSPAHCMGFDKLASRP